MTNNGSKGEQWRWFIMTARLTAGQWTEHCCLSDSTVRSHFDMTAGWTLSLYNTTLQLQTV